MTFLIDGYKAVNALSGGKLNKFILKNSGKLLGVAVNKFTNYINKPQWGEKVSNIANKLANMATESLGSNDEITKNLNNASTAAKGDRVAWANLNETPSTSLAIPVTLQETKPYVRNVGGSNFKRYVRARGKKFGRVKVGKFVKKKKTFNS